ncbi:MAG: acyltransferase family protein [Streptosporangiales bacterium]|nr:acyltransferase family protein [Streptosporangiales bacterium]
MSDSTASTRERYLDVLRAVALIRVVAYHTFNFGWFSILFPSMGVMFALAGSLMASSLDRSPGTYVVRNRIRRLLPSLWVFGLVVVPVMLWHGWPTTGGERPFRPFELVYWVFPIFDPPGSDWGADATGPLWYVRAYLWFVLLSPLALWFFRRWPVPTILAPIVLVGGYASGALRLDSLGTAAPAVIDFGTYGACWVLGFAHRAGMIRRLPLAGALGLAAGTMLLGGAWTLVHPDPEAGYDLNDIPLGQALWCLGAVLILLRFAPTMDWLDRTPVLGRLVTVINARALTIYLWHNVAINLIVPINDRLGLYTTAEQFAMVWLPIAAAVLLFGWVEDLAARRRPQLLPGGPRRRRPVRAAEARRLPETVPSLHSVVLPEPGRLRREAEDEHGPAVGPRGGGEGSLV